MEVLERFLVYIERVLGHEGGFTLDRKDRGNWTGGHVGVGELKGTKYGISAAAYPHEDIANLTRARAIELYRRDFWDKARGDELPPQISFQVLDAAVNHGIIHGGNVVRWLQRAAGVLDDGYIGPVTLRALAAADPADLVLRFLGERIDFYTRIETFSIYGVGWMRRMAENLRYAAEDN